MNNVYKIITLGINTLKKFRIQFFKLTDFLNWNFIQLRYKLWILSSGTQERKYKTIPIIINNYNRLTFLKYLIKGLEGLGYFNIYIIDNASTYKPLLEYYKECKYTVYKLSQNVGHLSLWKTGIYKLFKNQYFIYTDSDISLGDNCPENFVEILYDVMDKYNASKVGLALRIDDLPSYNNNKIDIINWESKFWIKEVEKDVFEADIDTTFALYYPNLKWGSSYIGKRYRISGNLLAKHNPWYNNTSFPTEEEKYYILSCNSSSSWCQLDKQSMDEDKRSN